MLAGASGTLLEVFVPTAMCGVIEDALRTAQAGLTGKLDGHAAGTLRQGLLTGRLGRHNGAARRLKLSERYEG